MLVLWLNRELVQHDRRGVSDDRPPARPRCSYEVERAATGAAAGSLLRRTRASVGRQQTAADAAEATHHEVAVPGAQALVGEAVDEEVDAGVQVRDHRRVQVNRQRKTVELVQHENDGIRRPANAENDEDDDDHFDLPDRFHDRRLGGPRSHAARATASATAGLKKAQFGSTDVNENVPVAEHNDGEGQQHADDDVEQGVLVWQRSVPETLLRLAVERVRRPADVAGNVERHTDQPRRGDDGEIGGTHEEATVGGMMADVNIAVDADTADAE